MKKALLILSIATLLSLTSYAQWSIGMSGGGVYNHYDYDPQYMEGYHYKGKFGFPAVDLPVNYQFNDWFSLSSGLSFHKKGYRMTGVSNKVSDTTYLCVVRNDSYLALPILTKFSLPFGQSKLKASFDVGGYASYWILSNYQYIKSISGTGYLNCEVTNQPKEFRNDVDRRLEIGIVGGIDVEYLICQDWTLFCATRCFYALTPQQKDYQLMHFPSRNITITGQLGIMYNFKLNQQ